MELDHFFRDLMKGKPAFVPPVTRARLGGRTRQLVAAALALAVGGGLFYTLAHANSETPPYGAPTQPAKK